jgi:plasmid replication initiation protein
LNLGTDIAPGEMFETAVQFDVTGVVHEGSASAWATVVYREVERATVPARDEAFGRICARERRHRYK